MKPLLTLVLLSLVTSTLSFSQITETKIPGIERGFGHAVSIETDRLLIGSVQGENSNSAYFFQRSGVEWTLSQTVFGGGPGSYDRFGAAVALLGNTALVGSGDRFNRGSFYSYEYDGTTWEEISRVMGDISFFGSSVSIDGNSALMAAIQGLRSFTRPQAVVGSKRTHCLMAMT